MKLAFLSCLAAILISSVCFAADPTPPAPASTYTDNAYNFSLAGPDLGVAKGTMIPLTIKGPAENGFAPNVNVMIQPGKISRQQYVQITIDGAKQFDGTFNVQKELQVSGHDAEMLDYQATMQGHKLHFLALAVFTDDKVYLVTCTDTVEDFPNHQAEFQKCIDSFKLTK